MFKLNDLKRAIRAPRRNAPRPRVVWIEQTTNLGGGAVWPLGELQGIWAFASSSGLAVHMDGARLMNAAVAHGVEPKQYGALADSLWIDFTKGLGAPFGAVLAGSEAFIEAARRYKHMLGGAMRQGGIMAAACLHALDHNVARLADDHANAALLADGLKRIPGFEIAGPVETNIVIADVSATGASAQQIAARVARRSVRVGVFGPATLRLITHCDVSKAQIELALKALSSAVVA